MIRPEWEEPLATTLEATGDATAATDAAARLERAFVLMVQGRADLAAAAGRVRPSTAEWFATARNWALFANEGGAYDDGLDHLNRARH